MATEKATRAGGSIRSKARRQAASPGTQCAEVTAASRPPGGSIAHAERRWFKSASWRRRATPGLTENGGFIRTTVGRTKGRWSAMASALQRVTDAPEKSPSRSPARVGASSFRCSAPSALLPSAHSASTASMPVPAEGSSTTSPGRTAAAWSAA